MIDLSVTDFLLGFVSVMLTISTFVNARKKDSRTEGAQEAAIHADIKYIKELLQDVRSEMKELTKSIDQHSEKIAKCEEQLNSAFSRIERLEKYMDSENGG